MARNDQRRRRVMIDGALQHEELPSNRSLSTAKLAPAIPTDAKGRIRTRANQTRTTDLLPTRPRAIALYACSLLSVILLLNGMHWLWAGRGNEIGKIFSLGHSGSFSCWVAIVLWMLGFANSMQIFALRQHRPDDYQGTYRIWLLFAATLLVLTADLVINFENVGRRLFFQNSSGSLTAEWAVVLGKLTGLALLFVRALIEVRGSAVSLILGFLAWGGYVGGILLEAPQSHLWTEEVRSLVQGNLFLVAQGCLLMGMAVYGRHVLFATTRSRSTNSKKSRSLATRRKKSGTRPSQPGEHPANAKQKREASNREQKSDPNLSPAVLSEPASGSREDAKSETENKGALSGKSSAGIPQNVRNGPLYSRIKSTGKVEAAVESSESDLDDQVKEDSVSTRHLSKTERKKLRRLQDSSRRAA